MQFILVFFLLSAIPESYAQSSKITVEKLDKGKIQNIIKEREGKPLFVNIWATWCVPCREEFPDLIKLAGKYKGKVDFVGISVDYDDEIETKINPFLKNFKVNFPQYVNAFENAEQLINFFDKDWNGAIPATFIFDKYGKKVISIFGKEDFKTFESKILQVIGKLNDQ
jgi:thiol-disulfide isomerase/thioredoxin